MDEKLAHVPPEKLALLNDMLGQVSRIKGVAAIVLGGSYASRTQRPDSDLDIGIYYREESPFDIPDIKRVANILASGGDATVTQFYEWGAWVNGGAWIHTPQGKMDFLYRNIEHVQRTIAEAGEGISHHDYDQQPAYGFYSVMYLAETQICIPLFDPKGVISDLKTRVAVYSPKLKENIIAASLWSAEFTLIHARGFAERGEVYAVAGCLTRAAANLTQALFALNERYFMRDKQVFREIAEFEYMPENYTFQLERILAAPGGTPDTLQQTVSAMEKLWRQVAVLPDVNYRAQFIL